MKIRTVLGECDLREEVPVRLIHLFNILQEDFNCIVSEGTFARKKVDRVKELLGGEYSIPSENKLNWLANVAGNYESDRGAILFLAINRSYSSRYVAFISKGQNELALGFSESATQSIATQFCDVLREVIRRFR